MKDIVIYSSAYCPYCIMAKELLESKNMKYKELRIDEKFEYAKESVKRSGEEKQFRKFLLGIFMWEDMMTFTRWIRKESSIHCLKASVSLCILPYLPI